MITALLLAAGESRRFGGGLQKLVQELEGKPVVRWSAESLIGPSVDEVTVVVGEHDQPIREALRGLDVRFVRNPQAREGMATSLALGLDAVSARAEAVLVALGDEPMTGRLPLERVVERYRAGGAAIVAPLFRGVRGHPVLFDRSIFPELRSLTGDRGARTVVELDESRCAWVELDLPKPVDVDTPADLARVRR